MSTTMIGVIVTALTIKIDQFTQYKYYGFPLIALVGTMTVIASLIF